MGSRKKSAVQFRNVTL